MIATRPRGRAFPGLAAQHCEARRKAVGRSDDARTSVRTECAERAGWLWWKCQLDARSRLVRWAAGPSWEL